MFNKCRGVLGQDKKTKQRSRARGVGYVRRGK